MFLFYIIDKMKNNPSKSELMLEGMISSVLVLLALLIPMVFILSEKGIFLGLEVHFFAILITIILSGWFYSYQSRFQKLKSEIKKWKLIIGAMEIVILFLLMIFAKSISYILI